MNHVPLSSSVLQRRCGYKDVLRHHLALRAAACLPVDDEVMSRHLLGMKDVAALYELWCFFSVVRALEGILGRPARADRPRADDEQLSVGWGMSVAWSNGVEVFYNLSFGRRAPSVRRSASLLLRPDVVVWVPEDGGVVAHVLDAKLRVQGAGALEHSEEDDAEPLSFKRDDVVKMHAYRDALPGVRSAVILYPGHEVVVFGALDANATALDAVGAIPLIPGGGDEVLDRWLRAVLSG